MNNKIHQQKKKKKKKNSERPSDIVLVPYFQTGSVSAHTAYYHSQTSSQTPDPHDVTCLCPGTWGKKIKVTSWEKISDVIMRLVSDVNGEDK